MASEKGESYAELMFDPCLFVDVMSH